MTPRWFVHAPVMEEETTRILSQVPAGVVLDATVGAAVTPRRSSRRRLT